MFLTMHAVAGMAIGNSATNPLLSFILGFASHFILDRIPHLDPSFDTDTNEKFQFTKPVVQTFYIALADMVIASFFIAFFLWKGNINFYTVLPGIIGAVLPDYLVGLAIITKNKYLMMFKKFHDWCHFDYKKIAVSLYGGSMPQIATLILSAYFLLS